MGYIMNEYFEISVVAGDEHLHVDDAVLCVGAGVVEGLIQSLQDYAFLFKRSALREYFESKGLEYNAYYIDEFARGVILHRDNTSLWLTKAGDEIGRAHV